MVPSCCLSRTFRGLSDLLNLLLQNGVCITLAEVSMNIEWYVGSPVALYSVPGAKRGSHVMASLWYCPTTGRPPEVLALLLKLPPHALLGVSRIIETPTMPQ